MGLRRFVKTSGITLAILVLSAVGNAVYGQEKSWENQIAIYLWMTGMSGDVTALGRSASMNVSFDQLLDNLKFGAMLNYQGRGRKWVVTGDVVYAKLGSDLASPPADITFDQWIISANGGYRALPWLDLLAGARVIVMSGDIQFQAPSQLVHGNTDTWVDPMIGLRALAPLGRHFDVSLQGQVGGLIWSDFGWQAAGAVNWKVSRLITLGLGYRALGLDWSGNNGLTAYDLTEYGPVVGVGFRF
jgi:opacity protein-like surface antigen